jgi:hypothetical protein
MLLRRKNLAIILETARHSFDTKSVFHRLLDYALEIPLHRMQDRR